MCKPIMDNAEMDKAEFASNGSNCNNTESATEYSGTVAFIKELERLKDTTRTAWTKTGRRESVAEHSWRLAVLAMVLEDYIPGVDFGRVIRMCLIHDIGEAYEGDISATIEVDPESKRVREERAVVRLLSPLPENMRSYLLALGREYDLGETKEARIAKAIDKMETIIQHNQGKNPADFDYEFNLEYGKRYAADDPVLKAIREMIDADTRSKVENE